MELLLLLLSFFISRKVSRKYLFSMAIILTLICFGVLAYSVIGVGGWEGMGLGFVTISVSLGIWIGTIIGAIKQKKGY
ncbi:YesK family protein [Virgibacillus halophilus]|uniref:YesK family protein n=1 Tax=Tigheibacillus halophilus TaxID=361280 RepID=A0ABU5C5J6_9BACI|nr:YesK family protein [Virgibacillus halophilus]